MEGTRDIAGLSALWTAVRAEMTTLLAEHDDGYYAYRLQRGAMLETYEEAVFRELKATAEPSRHHLFEIGAGWGPLCIALAAIGFRVTAFNGEPIHLEAMRRVVNAAAQVVPAVGRNITMRVGFFPYSFTRNDLTPENRNVLISTNIINEINRSGQDAMLAAAAQFDRFVVDIATFARDRNEREQNELRSLLARGFVSRKELWGDRMLDMEPKPGRRPWLGPRPPAPDWVLADPARGNPIELTEYWSTLSRRDGHCWTVRLPQSCAALCDAMDTPLRSPLRLLEDGALLGPPHSTHDDIARLGGGCYSHWSDDLYFSTSDRSHPLSNGRRYQLVHSGLD